MWIKTLKIRKYNLQHSMKIDYLNLLHFEEIFVDEEETQEFLTKEAPEQMIGFSVICLRSRREEILIWDNIQRIERKLLDA